jgi:hypothetical protein
MSIHSGSVSKQEDAISQPSLSSSLFIQMEPTYPYERTNSNSTVITIIPPEEEEEEEIKEKKKKNIFERIVRENII